MPRTNELGTAINFADAVEPAKRLTDLYGQLPVEVLDLLSVQALNKIREQSDGDYNILKQILDFEAGSPKQDRDSRLQQLENAYDPAFQQLHPYISYSVRKSTDFSRLERDARALIQNVTDRAEELQKELENRKKDAGHWRSKGTEPLSFGLFFGPRRSVPLSCAADYHRLSASSPGFSRNQSNFATYRAIFAARCGS